MHIVKTWGTPQETTEYLEYNMYEGVKHLVGKLYFCKRLGHALMDVAVLV